MSKDSDYEDVADVDIEVIDESLYRPVKAFKPKTPQRKWIALSGLILILITIFGFAFGSRLIPPKPEPISIEIEYNYSWAGSIEDGKGLRLVSGTGPRAYDMGTGKVAATIHKSDNSSRTLTVRIMQGEHAVEEQSTSKEYGIVTVSYKF